MNKFVLDLNKILSTSNKTLIEEINKTKDSPDIKEYTCKTRNKL